MHERLKPLVPDLDTAIRRRAAVLARQCFLDGGFEAVGRAGCRWIGGEPIFLRAGTRDFVADRGRLNAERGLVIANHPGSLDPFILLRTLTRDDVQLIVMSKYAPMYREVFGAERIVPVKVGDVGLFRGAMARAHEHIGRGGLTMLFPTGGLERLGGRFVFKSLFRGLLRSCSPADMVYAFAIDPAYVAATGNLTRRGDLRSASDIVMDGAGAPSALRRRPVPVAVDEAYTRAAEWDGRSDEALTAQYLARFSEVFPPAPG